jgi:hypothetical protein
MRNLLVILLSLISITLNATNYWVTPRGNDSNAGTDSSASGAWASWYKFSSVSNPGDTVVVKGGIYYATAENNPGSPSYSRGIYLYQKNGTAANPIVYMAYPGDTVIWDMENVNTGYYFSPSSFRGMQLLNCSYLKFKGLTFRNLWGDSQSSSYTTGIYIESCTKVTVEQTTCYNTRNVGFYSAYNDSLILKNCDSYNHCDSFNVQLPGNDGYGFRGFNWTQNDKNTFYQGCRAWNCSDDGFTTTDVCLSFYDSCWSFNNGNMQGEGHGFKMGWVEPMGVNATLNRRYAYCLAVYNRSCGFVTNEDQSSDYTGSMEVYNNTAYHNGYYATRAPGSPTHGFFILKGLDDNDDHSLARVFRNNLSYDNEDGEVLLGSGALYTHSNNSWDSQVTVTDADFLSVDSAAAIAILKGPRQADGSLPDLGNFLKLGSGSDLIDAGEDTIDDGTINELRVIPETDFNGSAPDLGAFEYTPTDPPVLPIIITTTNPFYLTESTARSGGYIVDDGGSAILKKGVCWNTTGTPTVRAADADSSTNDGNSSGSFSSTMWGLVIGTTYYVRAYAINSVDTAYGDQDAFTFIGQMKYVYVNGSPMMIQTKRSVVTTGEAESEGEPVQEYGDEMISNGGFADATGWDVQTGWTISGNAAAFNDINSGARLDQDDADMVSAIKVSTTYRLTFDIGIGAGGYARMYVKNASEDITYVATNNYPNGTNIIEFTTPSNITYKGISFIPSSLSTASFTIDNISLKEVL